MECQPQNPEFRNNPENFHPRFQWKVCMENSEDPDQMVSSEAR